MFDKRLFNVTVLGLGFMFVFTAFQTFSNVEVTILNSLSADDKTFTGNGYTSLAIIYAMLAIGNWLAPSIIGAIGARMSMVIGSLTYLLFIASFLIPKTWLLYTVSALMGIGASLIWTGQGNYLTLNSDDLTMARNSGIFWALLQSSMLYGNCYVFIAFEGKQHIDEHTRNTVTIVLTALSLIGLVFLVLLRPAVSADGEVLARRTVGPIKAFREAMSLLTRKEMIFLCITFLYTGFELSFYSGVYSPSIGFTLNISDNPKRLTGLSGIAIGVGEIAGGLLFGLLGSKTVRWGRSPIVILGFVVHIVTFFCIFLNLPNSAPLGDTTDQAYIQSNVILAIACSVLLGFADSCFNTQIYAAIGTIFSEESAPAFAIFKFTQSLAAASAFFYSKYIGLYIHLAILVVWATLGTATYCITERMVNNSKEVDDESQINQSKRF
ncbi:UNC93-like protein MFSD11 [Cimex lectularius]|uniref:UNC93-like protein MFSD11 n=1 Tax=Cimex lectularius TaxID=79782 RepID=A0A8I6RU09_CIMLE|nr:UNC93-like protein MFSD11 [Cimex lectularius]